MQERIYCSEQIAIPPQLPGVIKEYAKVVLRERPADLVEFSCKYFAQLSTLAAHGVRPTAYCPDLGVLVGVYRDLVDGMAPEAVAERHGIPAPIHASVIELLRMAGLEPDPLAYVLLVLSLAHVSMSHVIEAAIAVVSPAQNGEVRASVLVRMLSTLSSLDPRVEADLLDACSGWVRGLVQFEGDDPLVSYESVAKAGFLPTA
ncbi:Regulatory subunit of cAMP-dependent protein kinase [Giardia muris]|uniref:Regulatory subunit of cAMP-dependent protein kinase n=1 Tax=Giardia muris TaxID=5742 RepID=A0A4Z1SPS8_GIAMU|nr:Regulatory subunit of cAMP-dependent protein kinase [Giardia muris]|eukprot:TNJ27834.1 Regulatory subunit of cAMP-dependent protein kinase [Giardia muris]